MTKDKINQIWLGCSFMLNLLPNVYLWIDYMSYKTLLILIFFRFCAHICETRPLTQQVCILPRDCLVSNWSTWSNWTSIGQPYPSGTSRDSYTRSRDFYRQMGTTQAQEEKAVLRRHRNLIQVSRGRGKACPSLVEDKLQLPKLKVLPCNR